VNIEYPDVDKKNQKINKLCIVHNNSYMHCDPKTPPPKPSYFSMPTQSKTKQNASPLFASRPYS
jgi:hypothetical protein